MILSEKKKKKRSRAAPPIDIKKIKKKYWVITVILLFAAIFFGVFFYRTFANSSGFWNGQTPAARNFIDVYLNEYYPKTNTQERKGYMRVYFYKTTDPTRGDFISRSTGVNITATDPASSKAEFTNPSSPNPYSLSLRNQTPYTALDATNKNYERVTYDMTFKLPAHYKVSYIGVTNIDKDTNSVNDVNMLVNGKAFGTYTHVSSDTTVTVRNLVNLKQTGMITTDGSGNASKRGHACIYITVTKSNYSLTYNPNGGTITNANTQGDDRASVENGKVIITRTCGESVGQAPLVSRDGYRFDGWYYSNGTKLELQSNPLLLKNAVQLCGADQTVTARWTAYQHNVVYDLQGGAFPSTLKEQSSLNGYKIIPNGIYSLRSDCGSNMYMHVKGALYEAQSNPATVIYYGKGVDLGNQQNGADNYLWSISDEGYGKISIYNKATNKCLNVKNSSTANDTWIEQASPDHSSAQRWTLEEVSQQDYADRMQYGNHNLYINSVAPQKTNYSFACWAEQPDGSGKTYAPEDVYNTVRTDGKTVTLYAIWNVNDFKLSFSSNGGKGSISSITHKGYQSYTLPANTFTRAGYTFIGWSSQKYTDTISYKDKAVYDNKKEKATLYAQWQRNGTGFIQRPFMDSNMFYKALSILGNNGTTYNKDKVDSRMAHIDNSKNPGYFSKK